MFWRRSGALPNAVDLLLVIYGFNSVIPSGGQGILCIICTS